MPCRVGRARREDLRNLPIGRQPPLLDEDVEEGGDQRLGQGRDVEYRGEARFPRRPMEEDLLPPGRQEDGRLVRPFPDPARQKLHPLAEAVRVSPDLPAHVAATGDSRRKSRPRASILARMPNGKGKFGRVWPAGNPYQTGTERRFPTEAKSFRISSSPPLSIGRLLPATTPATFRRPPDCAQWERIR